MVKHRRTFRSWLNILLSTAALILVVVLIWRARTQLVESFGLLVRIPGWTIVIAVVLVTAGFMVAAMAYSALAFHKLRYLDMLLVEVAAAFVNRLVPGGMGGMGVHAVYLHQNKHSVAEATAVISANNLIGIGVHLLLLALVLAGPSRLPFVRFIIPAVSPMWMGGAVLLVAIVAWVFMRTSVFRNFIVHFRKSLGRYRKRPRVILISAGMMTTLTGTSIALLFLVSHAVNVDLGIAELFIAYSIGIFAGAMLPTPGGLAGVEAGLAIGLTGYGIDTSQAIAVALAFRIMTYWLPLIPGALALMHARQSRLL